MDHGRNTFCFFFLRLCSIGANLAKRTFSFFLSCISRSVLYNNTTTRKYSEPLNKISLSRTTDQKNTSGCQGGGESGPRPPTANCRGTNISVFPKEPDGHNQSMYGFSGLGCHMATLRARPPRVPCRPLSAIIGLFKTSH